MKQFKSIGLSDSNVPIKQIGQVTYLARRLFRIESLVECRDGFESSDRLGRAPSINLTVLIEIFLGKRSRLIFVLEKRLEQSSHFRLKLTKNIARAVVALAVVSAAVSLVTKATFHVMCVECYLSQNYKFQNF